MLCEKSGGKCFEIKTDSDQQLAHVLITLTAYWEIFLERFRERMYQTIEFNLVRDYKQNIAEYLSIYYNGQEDKMSKCLSENETVTLKRKKIEKFLQKFRDA
jgi:hypothetical protein